MAARSSSHGFSSSCTSLSLPSSSCSLSRRTPLVPFSPSSNSNSVSICPLSYSSSYYSSSSSSSPSPSSPSPSASPWHSPSTPICSSACSLTRRLRSIHSVSTETCTSQATRLSSRRLPQSTLISFFPRVSFFYYLSMLLFLGALFSQCVILPVYAVGGDGWHHGASASRAFNLVPSSDTLAIDSTPSCVSNANGIGAVCTVPCIQAASLLNVSSSSQQLTSGAGSLFVGNLNSAADFQTRRIVVRFDLGLVQQYLEHNSNDTVLDATLTLTLEKTHNFQNALIVDLFPLLEAWGAANEVVSPSQNGRGVPAALGDVTWDWTFFNITRWTTPGGTRNPVASATNSVGTAEQEPYSWGGETLANDIRVWAHSLSQNHGWILIARNEALQGTVRAFYGRTAATLAFQPHLSVTVGPPHEDSPSNFPLVLVIVTIFVVITLLVTGVYIFVVLRARRRQALGYEPIDNPYFQDEGYGVPARMRGGGGAGGGGGGRSSSSGMSSDTLRLTSPFVKDTPISAYSSMRPAHELEEDMVHDLIDDPNITVVSIADLTFKRLLGQGGYASVFLADWKSRNIQVAVKQLKMDMLAATATSDTHTRAEFIHEIRLMSTLNHPNILTLLGVCYSENMLLLTEFMEFGSLAQMLHVDHRHLQWSQLFHLATEIAYGLHYLHSITPMVVHRDLKSDNILVSSRWRAKVADFGLSRIISKAAHTMTSKGTPHYMAPEVITRGHFSEKSDVYAYGIILFEMFSGERPYAREKLRPMQILFHVGQKNTRPRMPDTCPEDFEDLYLRCVAQRADDRPSFKEILDLLKDMSVPSFALSPSSGEVRTGSAQSHSGGSVRRLSGGAVPQQAPRSESDEHTSGGSVWASSDAAELVTETFSSYSSSSASSQALPSSATTTLRSHPQRPRQTTQAGRSVRVRSKRSSRSTSHSSFATSSASDFDSNTSGSDSGSDGITLGDADVKHLSAVANSSFYG